MTVCTLTVPPQRNQGVSFAWQERRHTSTEQYMGMMDAVGLAEGRLAGADQRHVDVPYWHAKIDHEKLVGRSGRSKSKRWDRLVDKSPKLLARAPNWREPRGTPSAILCRLQAPFLLFGLIFNLVPA